MKKLMRFFKDEEGVVMIEYALIAALIGVALIVVLTYVAGGIENIFNYIVDELNNSMT